MLPACSTVPSGGYTQSPVARRALEDFPEVARNCELPEAYLQQFADEGRKTRLLLPAETYARREEQVMQSRIGCILHWASERGLKPIVLGAQR